MRLNVWNKLLKLQKNGNREEMPTTSNEAFGSATSVGIGSRTGCVDCQISAFFYCMCVIHFVCWWTEMVGAVRGEERRGERNRYIDWYQVWDWEMRQREKEDLKSHLIFHWYDGEISERTERILRSFHSGEEVRHEIGDKNWNGSIWKLIYSKWSMNSSVFVEMHAILAAAIVVSHLLEFFSDI